MTQAQNDLHKNLQAQIRFEVLLAEISAAFINLPADQVDQEIAIAHRRVCECLDLDRSTLWQLSPEAPKDFLLTHVYQRQPSAPLPERVNTTRYFPWLARELMVGREAIAISKLSELPPEAERDRESFRVYGTQSSLVVPLMVGGGEVFGALAFAAMRHERSWPELLIKRLKLIAQVFATALARKKANEDLLNAFAEIQCLKEQLEGKKVYAHKAAGNEQRGGPIVGQSDALHYVLHRIDQVAGTDATVLVLGETGSGKGLIANALHARSRRKDRPVITVNCASLPANLIESELFGREKGAFTGSVTRELGRFEVAHQGSIFLDEIGELPPESQAKLLRVLESGEFERLGSAHTIKVDVRVIAATSRDLKDEIKKGRFRQDLYYRLNVFPITVPPLRNRIDDIPLLVEHFVKKFAPKIGRQIEGVSKEAMKALRDYSWPGNVRELEHVIERAVITTEGSVLRLADFLDAAQLEQSDEDLLKITDVERKHILTVLEKCRWRIEGNSGAAQMIGLSPSTLRSRMQRLGIVRTD